MRILLFACYSSIAVTDDALVLAARGYDVVTWFDLHMPDYRLNRDMPATDAQARQNMAVELLENTQAVLHPEATAEQKQFAAYLCRLFGASMVRMEDLPFNPPAVKGEAWDALNMLDEVEHPTDPERIRFETPVPKAYRGAITSEPIRAGHVVIIRVQGEASLGRRLLNMLRSVERRANALLGDALKNPMVRHQRTPIPYVLDTSPPLMTAEG